MGLIHAPSVQAPVIEPPAGCPGGASVITSRKGQVRPWPRSVMCSPAYALPLCCLLYTSDAADE